MLKVGGQGNMQAAPHHHSVAWEVPWIPTQTDRVTGTCRQTAPNSDRHRSMIQNIDRWGHGNSRERDPTTSRTESQVEAMTGGWAHRAPRQTQREVVRGTQGSWDEHDAFVTQTKPWLTGFKLQSQAPYLEDPFPLGELLLILQDPAQVFPLLRSLP